MTDGNDEANTTDSNHYRPFQQVQRALLSSLQTLFASTSPSDLSPTTSIAGALTLALTYINKSIQSSTTLSTSTITSSTTYDASGPTTVSLSARILILSVSGDLAAQYIPIMNTIFACQRQGIPIDIAKIAGDTVFLQQASDATKGTYIKLERPQGLLQYLMMGFMSDGEARRHLVAPTAVGVDFRAACFCHRRVVDTGWVCSVCLSSKLFQSLVLETDVSMSRILRGIWKLTLLMKSSFLLPTRRSYVSHLWDASEARKLWSEACGGGKKKEETKGKGLNDLRIRIFYILQSRDHENDCLGIVLLQLQGVSNNSIKATLAMLMLDTVLLKHIAMTVKALVLCFHAEPAAIPLSLQK